MKMKKVLLAFMVSLEINELTYGCLQRWQHFFMHINYFVTYLFQFRHAMFQCLNFGSILTLLKTCKKTVIKNFITTYTIRISNKETKNSNHFSVNISLGKRYRIRQVPTALSNLSQLALNEAKR